MNKFKNAWDSNISKAIIVLLALLLLIGNYTIAQVSYCDTATITTGLSEYSYSCNSDSLILITNPGFNNYQWSNGTTTNQTTIFYSGLYYLTVTDDSSCTHVDSIAISLINGNITQNDTSLCFGDNLTLTSQQFSDNPYSMALSNSSYATFINDNLPIGNQERTVEFWLKNEGQTGTSYIFNYGQGLLSEGFSILINQNDSLILEIDNTTYTCTQVIPQNVWTHISISTDPSQKYTFFIDGQFITSNFITGLYNTQSSALCYLGKSPASNTGYFNGKIDELRIWNRFVNPSEYNRYLHLNSFYDPDLLKFWDFNNQIGNEYFDMNGSILTSTNILASNDVPFISYQYEAVWNNFLYQDSFSVVGNSNSTIYFSLFDGLSYCYDSVAISVVQPPQLLDSVGFCNTDTISLDAGLGYDTYLWNTGSSLQSIDVTLTGSYNVETTAGTCSYIDSVYVSMVGINIIQDSLTVCYGDIITLEANSNVGDYYWNTDQITSSIEVIAINNASYNVISTDGYTSCYDMIDIIVIPEIIPGLEDTIVGCNISSINLFVPGQPYPNYLWSNGDTSLITTVTTDGLYMITVTDGNSCFGVDSAYVSLLNADIIQSDTVMCNSSNITLNASLSSSNYMWSDGSTGQSITVSPFVSTIYTLNSSVGSYSCVDQIQIDVATPISFSLPDSLVTCESAVFTLDATSTGGNSYLWSTGQSSETISVSTSDIYYITVTGDYSCTRVDSTVVSIIDAFLTITDTLVCEGGEVIISTNSSAFEYSWSNGSSDAVVFVYPFISSNYHVFVSDGYSSCHLLTHVDVINVETSSIFGNHTVYKDSTELYSITETLGSTYQWFISGGVYTNNTGPEIEITWGYGPTGYISVTETSSEGCVGVPVELDVIIQFADGIDNQSINNEIRLYPNPVTDKLFVSIPSNYIGEKIAIMDITGKTCLEIDNYLKDIGIPVIDLASGVYYIKIKDLGSKFIIK